MSLLFHLLLPSCLVLSCLSSVSSCLSLCLFISLSLSLSSFSLCLSLLFDVNANCPIPMESLTTKQTGLPSRRGFDQPSTTKNSSSSRAPHSPPCRHRLPPSESRCKCTRSLGLSTSFSTKQLWDNAGSTTTCTGATRTPAQQGQSTIVRALHLWDLNDFLNDRQLWDRDCLLHDGHLEERTTCTTGSSCAITGMSTTLSKNRKSRPRTTCTTGTTTTLSTYCNCGTAGTSTGRLQPGRRHRRPHRRLLPRNPLWGSRAP